MATYIPPKSYSLPPSRAYVSSTVIPPVRPASLDSISTESSCPNAGSEDLSDSDQATNIDEDSRTKPVQPCHRESRKEIAKGGDSTTEPRRSCTQSAGRKIMKSSSYRIETEYLKSPAMHASFKFDDANWVKIKNFPERIKDGIRTLLEKGWEYGIRKEGPCSKCDDGYYFKLKKRPFGSGSTYVVTRMTRNMVAYLASEGWKVQPVASILNPYDNLNFRKCAKPLPKCYWLALTYAHAGKWSLRDHLSILGGADELIDTIRLTLQEMNLISRRKKEHGDSAKNWHQFSVKGCFLRSGGPEKKKTMMLRIMERLEERGWVLYVGWHRIYHQQTDYEQRIGTWLCVKSREWTPTNPVKIRWHSDLN
ncbi:hypothetical protein BELL_0006g00380 [Botrytis elliptica]|uniref:Uncharacterized protein n=1 Tax=Botrytis elliptica TaxID=278938 RepID=A0A4Z1KH63_9HELO|nr:hypothetical protein EAE99_005911 [Botrytis elliptica]TGO80503.1 hypothetical protein BELL_0006g00380 [Botrytis elliptica]